MGQFFLRVAPLVAQTADVKAKGLLISFHSSKFQSNNRRMIQIRAHFSRHDVIRYNVKRLSARCFRLYPPAVVQVGASYCSRSVTSVGTIIRITATRLSVRQIASP